MITRCDAQFCFPFYTNFDPVFDQLQRMADAPRILLQTNHVFMNPTMQTNVHFDPRGMEKVMDSSPMSPRVWKA